MRIRRTLTNNRTPAGARTVAGARTPASGRQSAADVLATFEERFTYTINPLPNPHNAVPGPGAWAVTGALLWTENGRLKNGVQPSSPSWGASQLVGPSFARVQGRTLIIPIGLADQNAAVALGWASSATPGNPHAQGHGWTNFRGDDSEGGDLQVITPTGTVNLGPGGAHEVHSKQYYIAIVLQSRGAIYLITNAETTPGLWGGSADYLGVPKYPLWRVLYVDHAGSDATLWPYASFLTSPGTYPGGHFIEDIRIDDLTSSFATLDGLANFADSFIRANGAIGNGWTNNVGSWTILGNTAQATIGTSQIATHTTGLSDAIYRFIIQAGHGGGTYIEPIACLFRAGNTGNKDFWALGTLSKVDNSLQLQIWANNAFSSSVTNFTIPFHLQGGVNYPVDIYAKGTKILVLVAGQIVSGGWYDIGATYQNQMGIGMMAFGGGDAGAIVIVSYAAAWVLTASLTVTGTTPLDLGTGVGGPVARTDAFTDANGTALASHTPTDGSGLGGWTQLDGTMTIQSNAVTHTSGGNATMQSGLVDGETSVSIHTPAISRAGGSTDILHAGILFRVNGSGEYMRARIFLDQRAGVGQPNSDEVEFSSTTNAHGAEVIKKLNLGAFFIGNSDYTLTARYKQDRIDIILSDGASTPVILSWVLPVAVGLDYSSLLTGTRVGLYAESDDKGCTFDAFAVHGLVAA